MRAWPILTLLVLCFACHGAWGEEPAPQRRYLPGASPEDVVALRVLTRKDGRLVPVAGARVTAWSEEARECAYVGATLLAEDRTDEHGLANLREPESGDALFHWVVESEGMARWHGVGRPDEVVLEPGTDRRIRVVDPMGEPLAGARVEYFLGCPHAPALSAGTTDARGEVLIEGLATDPNSDLYGGDLWVVAEGVDPGTYCVPEIRVGDGPPTLYTYVGLSASGVVTDPNGKPAAGVVVRQIGYPRGPVTLTDEKGRFLLFGIEPGESLGVYDSDEPLDGSRPNVAIEAFDPDVPLRVVLRRGSASVMGEGEPRHTVDVTVHGRLGSEKDVDVRLVRLFDGLTVEGRPGEPAYGVFRASLPPGHYRVVAGGAFSAVVEGSMEVDVPHGELIRLDLETQPTLLVRGVNRDEDDWARLCIPGHERTLDLSGQLSMLHLPAGVPAVLYVDRGRKERLEVGEKTDEYDFRIATMPGSTLPTRVRYRPVSADPDRPFDGDVMSTPDMDDSEELEDGTWELLTWEAGPARIETWEPGFQAETRRFVLPREVGQVVDLGEIVVHPTIERTFHVLDAAGKPVTDVEPRNVQGGNELIDEEGNFTIEVGPRPEHWVLVGDGWYSLSVAVSTELPEEIRFPAGRITVAVKDGEGKPLVAVGCVALARVTSEDGTLDLRGVPDGPHTIHVGAKGYVTEVREIVIADGATVRLEVVLRPAP